MRHARPTDVVRAIQTLARRKGGGDSPGFSISGGGGAYDPSAVHVGDPAGGDLVGFYPDPTIDTSGLGDVDGPASAGDDNIATFDGITGKLIQDSGVDVTVLTGLASTYQPLNAILTDLAGLTQATDRLPYMDSATTMALATFTAAGRALLDDADASAQRTTLGLGALATLAAGTGLESSGGSLRIAAAAAGDGLTGGAGSALAVGVDNSSIEISSDALRVKASGVTNAMLAGSISATKIAPDAWSSFTPTWATSGTAPSLGNGTLVGKWIYYGKTVHFRIKLTIGSTTTVGTGLWKFALPATASHSGYDSVGTVFVLDSGTDTYGGHALMLETTNVWPSVPLETGGLAPSRSVSNTHPITPATGDTLSISGTYEAA